LAPRGTEYSVASEQSGISAKREDTVIIKDVPAEICDNCGEYYLDEPTTDRVLIMAEEAVSKNAEVEILRFAA
jgi:hypothetical protein